MKSLIIGNGQIGSALFEIFSKVHETSIRDIEPLHLEGVEALHIAYPFSDEFVTQTLAYIDEYKPRLTMIHSSVPIGTTEKCGDHVLHTPERGRFPNLSRQMVYFKKFIGGFDQYDLKLAYDYFEACSWNVYVLFDPKITESLKLISNAHMGLEIAWRQEVERMGIDKLAYENWEDSYFDGYVYFGEMNLIRPRMKSQPIGGHCILPCVEMLSQSFDSPLLKSIGESNVLAQRKVAQESIGGNGKPVAVSHR